MKNKRFSDQVREAVAAAPMSRYEICKRIGFSEATMSRFMAGRSGISMDTLDKLATLLGWTLTTRPDANK